jgi:Cys-rich protein (TIGR01571 family)
MTPYTRTDAPSWRCLTQTFCIPRHTNRSGFLSSMFMILFHIIATFSAKKKYNKRNQIDITKSGALSGANMVAKDFESGLFDCCEGSNGCSDSCFACCCGPVRLGINTAAIDFMSFYVCMILTSLFPPAIIAVGWLNRMSLRREFGMDVKSPIGDCCTWFCCGCCALVQEGKLVDKAFNTVSETRKIMKVEMAQGAAPVVVLKQ